MSKDLSTQFPNPPELQPISSTASKIWRSVSLLLTFGGLALMAVGGWIFIQQQIEANKPPPARILEVSVADLESAKPTLSDTADEAASPIEAEALPVKQKTNGDSLVGEPVNSSASNSVEESIELHKEVVPKSEPELTQSKKTESPTETEPLEETAPAQEEPALGSDPTTTESPPSLADNPLPVVEDESISATVDITEPTVAESDDSTNMTVATGKPLTRIVAKSIGLDADVVEVGWETVVQNGVAANVWVVADYAAGWHKNSKLPGQRGNIVISAHHNIKGEVFRYTVDLEPGDIVILYDEDQSYDYVVVDKFILKDKGEPEAVRQANAKWIGPFDEERLTLVTCWPYTNNTHRLIVIAKPVGAEQVVTQ